MSAMAAMSGFVDAAVSFPAMLFTAALGVVVCFWVLVLLQVAEYDSFDTDLDAASLGLAGVPVSVSASLVVSLSWGVSLAGDISLARTGWPQGVVLLLEVLLLPVALFVAWRTTRLLVRPLAKLFPDEPGPSRSDFVGLTCTIRTGRVDGGFGQAEVASRDGSTAVVQVRQQGADPLTQGSTALLYAYDESGEFFWVAPYDEALDPRRVG